MLERIPSHLRKVGSSEVLAEVAYSILNRETEFDQDKEHFWVIGLNTKLVVKYADLVSLGTLDAALVHPREVFRVAIHKGVCRIGVIHNHPSGDPTPSREDHSVTESLKKAGQILGIEVIDSVIIGNGTGSCASIGSGVRYFNVSMQP